MIYIMRTTLFPVLLASAITSPVWQEDSECPDGGVQLLQSAKRGIYKQMPKPGDMPNEAIPFSSLVSESSSSSQPVMLNQIKQVVELAQTRVQTKVGEAPYFIIAVAIGGFALSLISICISLIFVERGPSKDGVAEEPNATALLAGRLRAMGLGGAGRLRLDRSEAHPRTWEHGVSNMRAGPMVDGHSRVQIVVPQPLEGGRLGLNLSEDDLVVNNFGDLRAYDFGFRIGDRIVQVNQVPVFKEADFRYVMQDAVRRQSERGEPIVFQVVRQAASQPMSAPMVPQRDVLAPSMPNPYSMPMMPGLDSQRPAGLDETMDIEGEDLRGTWSYGDAHTDNLYTYMIRSVGNDLGFEQTLPNGEKITGVLVQEGLVLRANLQGKQGPYGELRLQYDPEEKVLVSQFKKMGEMKWSSDILARKVIM